jgi:dGTPase
MLRRRIERESEEKVRLAAYAQKVADSAGRRQPEIEHGFRTAYQRDRARVIHSRAFRRLEYKTQVFLNGTGDHLRTRLTHTIEVASVARAIAAALGGNEDLAETIALAHDLGHAPFGHAGEDTLDELMRDHGGFEHNRQSLRVIELLESKFSGHPGLNLTWEVIEGLGKHSECRSRPAFVDSAGRSHPEECFPQPGLEAQIADAADEIAYYSHDLDDGLDHGLLDEPALADLRLWQRCAAEVRARLPSTTGKLYRHNVIRTLTDVLVEGLVLETSSSLSDRSYSSADDVRSNNQTVVAQDPVLADEVVELRAFLYQNLYHHAEVAAANRRACRLIRGLFEHYAAHPGDIGSRTARRIEIDGLHRCIADYLSGMTDRYIAGEAQRLGVLLEQG